LTAAAPQATAPPVPAQPVVPEPALSEPAAPQPAAAGPVAQEPAAAVHHPAAVNEEPAEPAVDDQGARPRPGNKKNARGRRSSVPSWDEIMLGSSRERD
jgi:hypothetical protein